MEGQNTKVKAIIELTLKGSNPLGLRGRIMPKSVEDQKLLRKTTEDVRKAMSEKPKDTKISIIDIKSEE